MRALALPVIAALTSDDMPHTRLDPKDRAKQLLEYALLHAESVGLYNMTRAGIATQAGVSEGLVSVRLGTMDAVRKAVLKLAIKRESLRIVAEGLVMRDPIAMKAPDELKARARASV